jgi:hypothetical protein
MKRRPAIILTSVIVLWIVLGLMGRGILPGSTELVNRLFVAMLPVTYLGLWVFAIAATRSPRIMLFRALGTTIVVALALLLLELPASLGWVHWKIFFHRLTGESMDYSTAYVLDADLGFRRIPGLSWTARPASDIEDGFGLPRAARERITFTYDRWGYRNAVEMEQADVVLLGDSYVEGWYVSDNQTVASRLSTLLGIPVANMGVAGYGTLQELRVLKLDALDRHPQTIVWFFFEGNDLYDDQDFETTLLAEPPTQAEKTPHPGGLAALHGWKERSFTLNALRWLRRWAHPLVPNRAPFWAYLPGERGPDKRIYFANYGAVPWTDFEEDRWTAATAAFTEGVEFAAVHGVNVVLVYIPTKYRVYRDAVTLPAESPMQSWGVWKRLPRHFVELCLQLDLRCVDLTEPFRRAVRQGVTVYARTDSHWGPEGHALVAEELAKILRNR